jgi:hypothetical protein
MLVLAIQFGLFVRAIVRVLAAGLLVAILLRDGLFDPGGIDLPPSLTYKADFVFRGVVSTTLSIGSNLGYVGTIHELPVVRVRSNTNKLQPTMRLELV